MAPRLAPSGGSVWQVFAATLPILVLLIWFLVVTHQRAANPPCSPYWGDLDEEGHQGMVVCDELVQVTQMVFVYMVVSLLWGILAVYLSFYVPRRHALLQRYLDTGVHKLGDVHYERELSCGGLRQVHWGKLTYSHVNFKVYPAYVSRRVPVLQHYSRERVTILLLPEYPFSGMPKSDIELDVTASTRQKKRMCHLMVMSWLWFLFATTAPIFILQCMDEMNLGFGNFPVTWNWIIYTTCVYVLVPSISLAVNHYVWSRYFFDITQNGQIAETQGATSSASNASTKSMDIEVGRVGAYKPPTTEASLSQVDKIGPEAIFS